MPQRRFYFWVPCSFKSRSNRQFQFPLTCIFHKCGSNKCCQCFIDGSWEDATESAQVFIFVPVCVSSSALMPRRSEWSSSCRQAAGCSSRSRMLMRPGLPLILALLFQVLRTQCRPADEGMLFLSVSVWALVVHLIFTVALIVRALFLVQECNADMLQTVVSVSSTSPFFPTVDVFYSRIELNTKHWNYDGCENFEVYMKQKTSCCLSTQLRNVKD